MRSHSPHVPVRSRVLYDTPSDVPIVFLIGCCVKSSSSGSQRPRTDLFILFFCRLICRPKRREIAPPHVLPQSHLIPKIPQSSTLYVGWLLCVVPSVGGRPQPPSVFFYFICHETNCHPKRRVVVLLQHSTTAKSRQKYPPRRCYCYWLVVALVGLMAAA